MINKNIMYEKPKGITLIALVITIIVLLILTGVTLNLIVGKESVISRADSTVILQEKTEILEYLKLSVSAININYLGNNRVNSLTSYFTDYNNYNDSTVFVSNSDFDTTKYLIQNYEVAGENTNKYVDISIKKNKGTGEVHRFIIKLGSDTNAENSLFAEGVEETLATMRISEVVEFGSSSGSGSESGNQAENYAIYYNLNGGTNPQDAKNTYTKGIVQQYPIPTYNGYVFDGWYENIDFTSDKVTSTTENSEGDIVIYAKWIIVEADSDYYTWSFEDDVVTITGLSTEGNSAYNAGNLATLVLPTTYNGTEYSSKVGQTVTKIGNSAFKDKININKVVIGDQITSIDQKAFSGCTGLSELTMPISINAVNFTSNVDQSIFYNCKNLTKVNFLKGTGVGADYASSGTNRVEYSPWVLSKDKQITVTMEEGITSIGNNMFYGCTGLKAINFPNSLTNISMNAFYNCTGLTLNNIDLPDTIANIGEKAFYGCSNITGKVEIPEGMTTISKDTFCGCSGIQNVIIGDQITGIEPRAFKNCTEISELTIPISINATNFSSSVSDSIFSGCAKIAKIRFSKGQHGTGFTYTTSGSTRYDYTPWYRSKSNLQTIILEKGINSIGNYTFNGLNNTTLFYYTGTDAEWSELQSHIGSNNAPLTNATVTCNYSE